MIDEFGIAAIGDLKLFEFSCELGAEIGVRIPAGISGEASVKQVETKQIFDVKIRVGQRAQFRSTEQMRRKQDMTAVLKFDSQLVAPVVLPEAAGLIDRADIDGGHAADGSGRRYEIPGGYAGDLGKYARQVVGREVV